MKRFDTDWLATLVTTTIMQAAKLRFTEKQATAILEMRLYRLIGLEILALQEEYAKLLSEKVDITLDAYTPKQGTLHPLTLVQKEIEDVFIGMGYNVAEGPELESDLYNFTKANTPEGHPARDMQDTFYVDPTHLLR